VNALKKTQLIHSELSHILAALGHTDMIVVCDSGLPIPRHLKRIDLALTRGVPGFLETVKVILSELCVERAWIASEMKEKSRPMYDQLTALLDRVPIQSLPHEEFKRLVEQKAVAVVRTGEYTPYANVILQSGVVF
jgi:D-ribose pyranase